MGAEFARLCLVSLFFLSLGVPLSLSLLIPQDLNAFIGMGSADRIGWDRMGWP